MTWSVSPCRADVSGGNARTAERSSTKIDLRLQAQHHQRSCRKRLLTTQCPVGFVTIVSLFLHRALRTWHSNKYGHAIARCCPPMKRATSASWALQTLGLTTPCIMMRTNRALLPQNAGGSRRTVTRCRAMSHMHLRSIRIAPSRATTALFGTSAVAHVDGLNVNTTLQLQVPCAIKLGVLYLSHLRAIGHLSPLHSSLSLSQGPQWTSQLERCARFRVLKVDSLSTLVRFACGLICGSFKLCL
jgi:hypothetical protein